MKLPKKQKGWVLMKTTGQRIKRLRERHGWSQLELSSMLHLNNSVLSRIESGKRPVDDALLIKLADLFQTSADYLLGRQEKVREVRSSYRIRPEEEVFWEQLREAAFYDGNKELSPEEKELIMELLLNTAKSAKKIISRSDKG